MLIFFGISEKDFFDPHKVKVINGIAGSAKSSNIDRILTERGVEYGRYTSTNKLKRDAEARYGGHNDTIAGGLFHTVDGCFFHDEKDPDYGTVVIDEILQTDSRVLNWIKNHVGRVNIIITTDTHQMLAPEYGAAFLEKFLEFCRSDCVVYRELGTTYRARTEETRKYFERCYKAVETGEPLFYRDRKLFTVIPFASMPYNYNDIYICHTNACESLLYETFRITEDYAAPLIPKGMIARKNPKNPQKYPILSQENARGRKVGYWQPEHIGTPTRYQGSEVKENQRLFYLIESYSRIEPREWYTVVSRCYNIRSLCIVVCEVPKIEPLTVYNRKPVKKTACASVRDDYELESGKKLSEAASETEGKVVSIPAGDMARIRAEISDTAEIHFRDDCFYYNGKKIMIETGEEEKPKRKTATSMSSLLQKESDYDYKYMPDFMRQYEKTQRARFHEMKEDTLKGFWPDMFERVCDNPFDDLQGYKTFRDQRSYQYGIDLKAAYPYILAHCTLPTGGQFFPASDWLEDDENKTSIKTAGYDWYIVTCGALSEVCVCGGDLVRTMQADNPFCSALYIGSSSAATGSRMGRTLWEMAHKSQENDKKRKEVHYGLMERAYVDGIDYDGRGHAGAYAVNERNNHQLLMLAIKSAQADIMLHIKKEVYGTYTGERGYLCCDALYFDYSGDVEELGERIRAIYPEMDFRIFLNSKEDKHANVIYKTYEDLLTDKENKRKRDRERIAEKRARAR